MKKILFTATNLGVAAAAIVLGFEPQIGFNQHWISAVAALLSSGVLFLTWKILAVRHGDWSYNPAYNGRLRVFGLPWSEIFFLTGVPYAALFLFELVGKFFVQDQLAEVSRLFLVSGSAAFIAAAYIFRRHNFTLLVCLSLSAFLATLAVGRSYLLGNAGVLIWYGFSLALVLPIRFLATALPVLRYNTQALLGVRVLTLPVEELFYLVAYLGFTLNFYLFYQGIWG